MKGVITSTYVRILKMDSTKKITKKLAGGIGDTAAWMTNIGNELGQVLNSVLTTAEGAGLEELCQGVVRRYQNCTESYTKTGTLQKGGKVLNVLRCGRGSSSVESFHRHQCAFIPGWRCNDMHTEMYMLEGASRWNMSRAKEVVSVVGASTLICCLLNVSFKQHEPTGPWLGFDARIHPSRKTHRGAHCSGVLIGPVQ